MHSLASLSRYDAHWPAALERLLPEIHPVDRDALRVWFQLYPLTLHELLETAPARRPDWERFLQLRGRFRLAETADTSHRFLYAHRYWPAVKAALAAQGEPAGPLEEIIRALAPDPLALPAAAIAWMTLRQTGPAFLTSGYQPPADRRSPAEWLAARATPHRPYWFARPAPRVVIDERDPKEGWFPLVPGQHLTTAAEHDKRPHHLVDERCYEGMGAIPVDCRSGSCGTCWVGVLGGGEHLAPVQEFEAKRMAWFGYWDNPFHDPARPLIRLACQVTAQASCSIVIPPWNGVWGTRRRAAL